MKSQDDKDDHKVCGTCRFFCPDWEDDEHLPPGQCRRRAPVVTGVPNVRWVSVSGRDWCGEWDEKP